MKIDPVRRAAAQLHRPEQPGAGALLRGRAAAHRRAHLPGRRPRFDAQRRRRLRRAAAEPVRAEGGQLLHRAGRRAGPRPRAEDHPRAYEAGSAGVRRRRRRRSIRASRRPRRCATACSRRPSTFRSTQLGTTDDCGFSPFSDDTSTSRETAFAKIRARVAGTALAAADSRRRRLTDPTTRRSCFVRWRCRTREHPAGASAGRTGAARNDQALERRRRTAVAGEQRRVEEELREQSERFASRCPVSATR